MGQTAVIGNFSGGINRRLPAPDIADNEVVDAVDVEMDLRANLRTRPGITKLQVATTWATEVTSMFHFNRSNGTGTVLLTSGTKVYRMAVGGGAQTDITGLITLPNGTEWQWVTFNDKAIGVNGATGSETNPVVVPDASSNIAALTGSPPKGKYIAVWNSRVFIVDSTTPNVIKWCKLGDETDWTTGGIIGAGSWNVGGNEGDTITGLAVWRGMLVIFKRTRIYMLVAGSPNTDSSQWEMRLYADGTGCVAARTIQPLMDDLVFLSSSGVVLLSSVQNADSARQSVLSQNVPELARLSTGTTRYQSAILPDRHQYWLVVPEGSTSSTLDVVWVMDYSRLQEGSVAWTRFTGDAVGRAYAPVIESNQRRLYFASGPTDSGVLVRWADPGVWTTTAVSTVLTKAYSFGDQFSRREFVRFGVDVHSETGYLELFIRYRFDEDDARAKFVWSLFSRTGAADYWDECVWDTGKWSDEGEVRQNLLHRIIGGAGRRGRTVQFRIWNREKFYSDDTPPAASHFVLKGLSVEFSPIGQHKAGEGTLQSNDLS